MLLVTFFGVTSLWAGDGGFVPLWDKDLAGWKAVPKAAEGAFALKDVDGQRVLLISGKPLAYLHTVKKYKDFVLRYEWKAEKEGRSGVLLHIVEPHRTWPMCVQVQAQQDSHGRLFTMGGAEGNFVRDKAAQKAVVKWGEWNRTEVVSNAGKLSVKINGTEVARGESAQKEGVIGIQSEGTEFLFRRMEIKGK